MKKIYQLLFSLLLTSISFLPAVAQEYVEIKQPESNKVVIRFMFRNGSISDPKGKEGLTYATAQTIIEGGTKELTRSQIKDLIYPMAASYSASIDKEVSIFTFAVPSDFLEQFYPIAKGLILSPTFNTEDFARVRSNQQNYVDQVIKASSDEEYSKKALEDFLFRGTNYQHMVQGTTSGVKSLTLDDVKEHYNNFFTRKGLIVGISGNYSDAFLKKFKDDVSKLPAEPKKEITAGKANMPKGIQVEIITKKDALGSAIYAGTPLSITRSNDDFAALMVANSFLGEHRKSYGKLYDKIRTIRSMNYGDYSYIEWYENGGSNMLPLSGVPRSSNYFSVWIRPVQIAKGLKQQYPELKDITTGHAHFALRLALREIDLLIKNGMTKEEFELTRTFLRSYIKLYVQTPIQQLGFKMDSRFYGRKDYINELDALLAKLTVEDVNKAIRNYWQIDNMYVTIVTDESEAEPLAKSFRENQTSPMSYSNLVKEGLPKDVLTEDDIIANFKLNISSVSVINTNEVFK